MKQVSRFSASSLKSLVGVDGELKSLNVLCMEGKIQKQTYDEIRLSLVDMEDELNKLIRKEG